jgi:hypothetical protein
LFAVEFLFVASSNYCDTFGRQFLNTPSKNEVGKSQIAGNRYYRDYSMCVK